MQWQQWLNLSEHTWLSFPERYSAKLNPEQKELATKLLEEGKSAKQIAKSFNVHPATIYRLGSKGEEAG